MKMWKGDGYIVYIRCPWYTYDWSVYCVIDVPMSMISYKHSQYKRGNGRGLCQPARCMYLSYEWDEKSYIIVCQVEHEVDLDDKSKIVSIFLPNRSGCL